MVGDTNYNASIDFLLSQKLNFRVCFLSVILLAHFYAFDKPASIELVKNVPSIKQKKCQDHHYETKWLMGLISDTGMRLSEAAGLSIADFVMGSEISYINFTSHPWRRLKTKSSGDRQTPIIGAALWASRRVLEGF